MPRFSIPSITCKPWDNGVFLRCCDVRNVPKYVCDARNQTVVPGLDSCFVSCSKLEQASHGLQQAEGGEQHYHRRSNMKQIERNRARAIELPH